MSWVVRIVRLVGPTSEQIVGPFDTSDQADAWLTEKHRSGVWEREKWFTPQIMSITPPEEVSQ